MSAAPLSALAEHLDVPLDRLGFLTGFADADLAALDAAVARALSEDDEAIHQGSSRRSTSSRARSAAGPPSC